jgi:hypothetical protein
MVVCSALYHFHAQHTILHVVQPLTFRGAYALETASKPPTVQAQQLVAQAAAESAAMWHWNRCRLVTSLSLSHRLHHAFMQNQHIDAHHVHYIPTPVGHIPTFQHQSNFQVVPALCPRAHCACRVGVPFGAIRQREGGPQALD